MGRDTIRVRTDNFGLGMCNDRWVLTDSLQLVQPLSSKSVWCYCYRVRASVCGYRKCSQPLPPWPLCNRDGYDDKSRKVCKLAGTGHNWSSLDCTNRIPRRLSTQRDLKSERNRRILCCTNRISALTRIVNLT